jgi:hypothetical protein
LTHHKNVTILVTSKKEQRSYEQEEYITLPEYRESGLVETDISKVMEWAWKLKSERSCLRAEPVVSFGTSPVIEDRIS